MVDDEGQSLVDGWVGSGVSRPDPVPWGLGNQDLVHVEGGSLYNSGVSRVRHLLCRFTRVYLWWTGGERRSIYSPE